MNLRKLYISFLPLKLRELLLPLFTSKLYLFFKDREYYRRLEINKKRILSYFSDFNNSFLAEELSAIKFIKKHGWTMFPGEYSLKFKAMKIIVYCDPDCGLLYVHHNGKRLYFKRSIVRKEVCAQLYRQLLIEQDTDCAHQYIDSDFSIKNHSILFDIGAAEGIFVLTNIEQLKHAYLFECDEEWLEALHFTFKPWNNRITIINKYVSDQDSETETSIDHFVKHNGVYPDFIKMDIEGAERKALSGAEWTLTSAIDLKLAICTYHNHDDAVEISNFFKGLNYYYNYTNGVLLILSKDFSKDLQPPFFRKGVIRASSKALC